MARFKLQTPSRQFRINSVGTLLQTHFGSISLLVRGLFYSFYVTIISLSRISGVGFSTADTKGYGMNHSISFSTSFDIRYQVADEDQMANDFLGFLSNLVKVFPSLARRPLYLTGESYAGMYIVSIFSRFHNRY
jgi:hypothetical protein